MFSLVFALLTSFGLTLLVPKFLYRFAPFLYLEDVPDERKRHIGKIPMVGGLSIFIGLLSGGIFVPSILPPLKTPLLFAFLLLLLGALDDARNIRAGWRLIVQLLIILFFLYFSGLRLYSFGNLFFSGDLVFFTMSGLVTLLAFCAGINAFNMIDGVDGLAALMGLVALLAMACLFYPSVPELFFFCLLFISGLFAFFLMNISFFSSRKKIFLGDAGAMFLGFMIAFLLIRASQGEMIGEKTVMRPITCVWLIAVPLMDMVGVMLRRIIRRQSPIQGDRNHLHHLLLNLGLSHSKVLMVMGCVAALFAGAGLLGEVYKISECRMFGAYLVFFVIYLFFVRWLSKHLEKKNTADTGEPSP